MLLVGVLEYFFVANLVHPVNKIVEKSFTL